ncbi:hypothetical protein VIGAN_08246300, partial [Vigna angularis var. angularis]
LEDVFGLGRDGLTTAVKENDSGYFRLYTAVDKSRKGCIIWIISANSRSVKPKLVEPAGRNLHSTPSPVR